MATIFNPTSAYSNNTGSTGTQKNWWDTPRDSQLGSQTTAGYTTPDFGALLGGKNAQMGTMLGNQNSSVAEWLKNYSEAIGNQETMTAMYSRLGDELGLPGLMRQADTTNATLEAIPETYSAATRGFGVNANQLARITGTKQAEMAPIAQRATTQAQTAQQQMAIQMQLVQAQKDKELRPYDYEREFMMDRFARETSMFTAQAENELTALIAKMNAGVTLSVAEENRKAELEKARMLYENNLAVQRLENEQSAANNRYTSIGSGGLYDTQTGQTVSYGSGEWG